MPSLVDFRRGFGGIIAALTVATLSVTGALTIGSGGSFTNNSTATSTFAGPVSSTKFIVGTGSIGSPSFEIDSAGGAMGIYESTLNSMAFTVNGGSPLTIEGGSSFITIGSVLRPNADNTIDVGALTRHFRDGFFKGTVSSTNYLVSSGGQIRLFGSGAASAPNLCFDDETDTCNDGFYGLGTDSFAATINGTETVRFLLGSTQFLNPPVPRTNNTQSLGLPAAVWGGLYATSSEINTGTTATSTAYYGDSDSPACQVFGDSDGGGVTYCTYLNGAQTCSTTDCRN